VQGLTVDDAKAKLAALGFKPVVDKPITDPAPKDHVAKQNPLPDAPATAGAVVTLTPSAGAETVAVPDLSRKTREEVNSTLQQLGLTLTIGTERAPANATPGAAFKQNPPAGTKVAKGSAVTVSFAPEATTTTTAGGGANGGGGGGSGGGGGGGGGSKGTTALPAPKPPG
jgi:serine/threonine-protein kinase